MASLIAKPPAFLSIGRLSEKTAPGIDAVEDEIIEVYLVLQGEVAIISHGSSLLLEGNHLYCTSRNEYTRAVVKGDTEGYVIRFSKSLLHYGAQEFYCSHFPTFQTLVLRGEVIQMEASFWDEGKKLCEMINQELHNESDYRMQVLSCMLSILLLHLIRKSNIFTYNISDGGSHVLVRRFNTLLEQKFRTNKRVSDYASLLCVTSNHLNGIIKQATGKSAGTLIRQRVVLEAVRQAKLTGASMKEVAYDLGFDDNAHFSKFFKKATGKNFSTARKMAFQ